MDVIQALDHALGQFAPNMKVLVVVSVPIVWSLVEVLEYFLKRSGRKLEGNIIQSVAAAISVVVVLLEGWIHGLYKDGISHNESFGLLLVSVLVYLGSVGFDQSIRNKNKDDDLPPGPITRERMRRGADE